MSSFDATEDQRRLVLPGDALVKDAIAAWTRGVTIAAPAQDVWPWLAQLGADRAGWYSYDFIDNGGRPSARAVLTEHQDVVIGQVLPALPDAEDAFVVADVVPGRTLLLTVPGQDGAPIVSWVFHLSELDESTTRLVVRARVSAAWRGLARGAAAGDGNLLIEKVYGGLSLLPGFLMIWAAGLGHGFMERRMLRGIKWRAEGRYK
jgi:hypothetical protein